MANFKQTSGSQDATTAPPFKPSRIVFLPQVNSLLRGENFQVTEDGVAWSGFARVSPDDSSEAKVGGR
jgi:hypothetical protein